MENINKENPRYEMAVERVQKIKKFYSGILVFAIVFGVIYGVRFFKNGFPQNLDEMQVSWIFIIWGLILAIKGVNLFFFNSDWENDMINKEIKKENNGNY
ncbi:2TM domain-containing protein [Epilithonimonas hungarica]|uniref:2TM domain-containing protein n=1 Tax=Epilithonimonas hungarica TaxID=454006 RepID=A0A1G7PVH3_9FLAO|nr:2TM domain-containing protein [Epilithonimonas hungarica]SDF90256.1 2TM domain-containing protein [Epilithonimonas hungarica]